jgi:hypothetical protein
LPADAAPVASVAQLEVASAAAMVLPAAKLVRLQWSDLGELFTMLLRCVSSSCARAQMSRMS